MLFNEANPYYYINGAWQSCTTPHEALRTLEDDEQYRPLAKVLQKAFETLERELKSKDEYITELEEQQAELDIEVFTLRDGVSLAYNKYLEMIYLDKRTSEYKQLQAELKNDLQNLDTL